MKNILFIRMRLLGDIIFTIPAISIYKKHFPGHNIYYVAEEKFRGIAELIPGIKKVIFIPYKMKLKDLLNFRKETKKIGFAAVVDFHSGPKSALLTRLTGIKTRIGYRTPNRNWAYNRLTPRNFEKGKSSTHSVYNQALLLEHLGIDISKNPEAIPPYPQIKIAENDIAGSIKEELKAKKKKITIHIGAGNEYRDWGLDKFSVLIRKLQQQGIHVFLIGNTENEQKRGAQLQDIHTVVNLTGKLSIKETLYLIANSDLYFGIDSGPLHLASLTKTPLVTIYGPNLPEVSGPWRKEDVTIIQSDLDCRPCLQMWCVHDTFRCMEDVTVDQVLQAMEKYL